MAKSRSLEEGWRQAGAGLGEEVGQADRGVEKLGANIHITGLQRTKL